MPGDLRFAAIAVLGRARRRFRGRLTGRAWAALASAFGLDGKAKGIRPQGSEFRQASAFL